jgi:1,4-alpha-glucan branching enzyme
MYAQPGKKLLFMGAEIGQGSEWNHETSLDWHLLDYPDHRGIERWVQDLNGFYRSETALSELDASPHGFEWVDCNDAPASVISLIRKGHTTDDLILAVANFTPVPRAGYRVGVPRGGHWREVLNGDAAIYGGSNLGNVGGVWADQSSVHGRPYSLELMLPPLAMLFLKSAGQQPV